MRRRAKRAIHDVDGGFVMAPMQTGCGSQLGLKCVTVMRHQITPNWTSISDARKNHGFGDPVDAEPGWDGQRWWIVCRC